MIVYKLTNGFASDLRYENDSYMLQFGEIKFSNGFPSLPSLESLHDPVAVSDKEATEEAERTRFANLRGDALAQDLLAQLRTATPMQISNYVDSNVTDLASARTLLKKIILVLSLIAISL